MVTTYKKGSPGDNFKWSGDMTIDGMLTPANINLTGKIPITSITGLENASMTIVNEIHAEGIAIEIPTRQNISHFGHAFIAPGAYEGIFGIGSSEVPLIEDPDQSPETGQFGLTLDTNYNYSRIELRGRTNEAAILAQMQRSGISSHIFIFDNGIEFSANNGSIFARFESGVDPITGAVGGLNMGGSRIYNCPDIGTNQYALSAGWIQGGSITDNGNGTATVSAGSGFFRASNSDTAYLTYQAWTAITNIPTPSIGGEIYVYAHFNGTVVSILILNDAPPSDINTNIVLGEIRNIDNVIYTFDNPYPSGNYSAKVNTWIKDVIGSVVSSGLITSSPAIRHIAVTSGVVWNEHFIKIEIPTFDSSGTDKFLQVYRSDLTGGFVRVTNQDTYDNTQYDRDGDGTLEPLTDTYWANQWIMCGFTMIGTSHPPIAVMMPQYQFTTQALAQAELAPSVRPLEYQDNGLYIARITYQKGSDSSDINIIKPTLLSTPANAIASNHNELAGLQGGSGNERYHMTLADFNGTGTGVMVRTTSPTIITPTIASFLNANHTHAAVGATGGVIDHVNLANKGTNTHAQIDTAISTTLPGLVTTHAALTDSNAHGATALATVNQIITRDAAGRAAVVAPSALTDIALLSTVNDHATLTTGVHGVSASTIASTANITTHAALTTTHGVTGAIVGTTDTQVLTNKRITYTAGSSTAGTAPIKLTAGPLLGTAEPGTIEFDGVVEYMTTSVGRGVVPAFRLVVIQTPFTLVNGTGAQNCLTAANDVLTIAANTTYFFDGQYIISNGTQTAWIEMGFALGGGASITAINYLVSTNSTLIVNTFNATASSTTYIDQVASTQINARSAGIRVVKFQGIIRMNAAGTIAPQIAFERAPGVVTMNVGSYIRFAPIGTGTVASVGPWN